MKIFCPHCHKTITITDAEFPNRDRADSQMTKKSRLDQKNLYVFQWPSKFGGADTKLVHTLKLWTTFMNVTVVPNFNEQLKQQEWTSFLENIGAKYLAWQSLPRNLEGHAIAFSNPDFVRKGGIASQVRERGLRTIWGNEMMFLFEGESETIRGGNLDIIVYPSLRCLQHSESMHGYSIKKFVVGNYIDPSEFPFRSRKNESSSGLVVGRLSRDEPDKYPEDFPVFYESMELTNPTFKVMAWSKSLATKYDWFDFEEHWHLLHREEESAKEFLSSLDLFLYPIGHKFVESWGRSTVEAMMTGAIPIVPTGHSFEEIFENEKHGYICATFEEFRQRCLELQNDPIKRKSVSIQAANRAREIMNPDAHIRIWKQVFDA